jgi:ceramide glucosyltransferase
MARLARHDVIILSDSDIEVGPDFLLEVIGRIAAPRGQCRYLPLSRHPSVRHLEPTLRHGHQHLFPAECHRWAEPGIGAALFRIDDRDAAHDLARHRRFAAFANQLADDYAIGTAVRSHGLVVAIPGFTIGHACQEDSFASLWFHELRWARTVRAVDPAGFAGMIITHPLVLALLGALSPPKDSGWPRQLSHANTAFVSPLNAGSSFRPILAG